MSDFKIIESQEQLDAIIGERLKRERETISKKYESYISPEDFSAKQAEYEGQISNLNNSLNEVNLRIANFETQIAEKDKQIKAHESFSVKTRIANELGLSFDAVNFLQGNDEASIRESAETLKRIVGNTHVAPLGSTENGAVSEDAALLNVIKNL